MHAINEEFVEAVEVLLEHEETIHKEGEPHVSVFSFLYREFHEVSFTKCVSSVETCYFRVDFDHF